MKEERKLKRGDIGPDGLVFWCYNKNYKNGQYWVSLEKSEKYKASKKAYQQSPEYKASKKAYRKSPEYKAYHKAYQKACRKSPEYKAYHKAYQQSPEYKASKKAYRKSPEYKAYHKAYQKAYRQRITEEAAAVQFFTLTNAASEISKALETKPIKTDEKT